MFFITTITNLIGPDVPFTDERWKKHSSRCVGYYEDLETAAERVENNVLNINEGMYEYAVIECIGRGIYAQPSEERWFRFDWETKGYVAVAKPEETKQTCNWSIG